MQQFKFPAMSSSLSVGFYKNKLKECAAAIGGGDLILADSVLREIKSLISVETDEGRRKVVNCYVEALVRRVYGIHPPYPLPFLPSQYFLESYTYVFGPFDYFAYLTTENAIKDAFTGNQRLHVIHFSIVENPLHWKWLKEDLSTGQPGGLQSFRLTSIIPKLTTHFENHLHIIRQQFTRRFGQFPIVDFKMRQLVANYKRADDIFECCMSKLTRTAQDEMLVVLWSFSLHKLLSQEVAFDEVLLKIKDLKPDMMIVVEQEANHNGPDFLNRLDRSFQYYSSVFESLEKDDFSFLDKEDFDCYVNTELSERYFRRQIGNVVSREGIDRVERHESLALWQQRLTHAGFLPVLHQLERLKNDWEKNGYPEYRIEEKDGHALFCRENFPLAVTSIWKPIELSQSNPGLNIIGQDVAEFDAFPPVEGLDKAIFFDFDHDTADDPTAVTGINLWSIRDFSMNQIAASAKLFDILEYMCHEYELPLALVWISSNRGDDTNSKGKCLLCIDETACYVNDVLARRFLRSYVNGSLEEGQGVAGNALCSGTCFVPDISTLGAFDNPFSKKAEWRRLHAVFAIKLTSIHTSKDYVLEFFLPRGLKVSSEQELLVQIELSSILKKKCGSMWIVWDMELNAAYISRVRFEDIITFNLPWAAASRSSQPASSGLYLNSSETMAFGTFNQNCDGLETYKSLLEQEEVRLRNALVAPAANEDNELVGRDGVLQAIATNKRRKVSTVWEGFNRHQLDNGEVWAICKNCNKKYRAESTRGTSNFHKHLKKCLASHQECAEQQLFPLVGTSDLQTSFIQRNSEFDQERSRLDIARMIIMHEYPLDIVQHEFFKTFLKHLQPMFELYSQDIVEADVLVVYKQEKERLGKDIDNLSCLFSLTIDLQSSDDKKVIKCCFTLHFIDDGWEMKKKVLAFRNMECNYDVGTLYEVITGVLTEWKINKNVHFIHVDIGPPNDHMVGELTSKLSVQIPFLNWDLCYLSCYAKILDLLVQEGFSEIQSLLCKMRESIEYVNGTPERRQKFQEAINQVKLQDKKMASRDVPTRWDTTFLMLESAIEFRKAFTLLELTDDDFKMNLPVEEWNMAAIICECLKVFRKSLCVPPTSIEDYFLNVCYVYKNLRQWEKSDHTYVRSMAERMKMKFDDYWGRCRFTLEIFVVLNPCFKLDLVEYEYGQIYGSDANLHLLRFRQDLANLYRIYSNDSSNLAPSTSVTDVRCLSYSPDSADKLSGFNEWRKDKFQRNVTDSQITELNQYLEQPPANLDQRAKILDWWRANAPNFPTLGKMARDFLAIPISTIISRSFSGEEVPKMNPAFNGVCPEIVEALVCGKDWIESPEKKIN